MLQQAGFQKCLLALLILWVGAVTTLLVLLFVLCNVSFMLQQAGFRKCLLALLILGVGAVTTFLVLLVVLAPFQRSWDQFQESLRSMWSAQCHQRRWCSFISTTQTTELGHQSDVIWFYKRNIVRRLLNQLQQFDKYQLSLSHPLSDIRTNILPRK